MALKGKHGAMLAGRYRLLEQLGVGGMGSVWKAEHLVLRSHVAIKIIDPDAARFEFNLARFLREAKTLASLRSPNVVQVLDFGSDADTPYLVMELLEGQTLGSRLTKKGRLSLAETSRVLAEVCAAMSLVHEQGLIHRDLKPDNIFLCEAGDQRITKIVDFGIAKSMRPDVSASMKTRTGHMLGTPSYMSPEQCRGLKDIDHRADLWALGVIAYECLVGKVPFEGEVLGDLLLRICMDPLPVPSRQVRGGLPEAFDAWFARAVARDREARFQSAHELATSLAALAPAAGAASAPLGSAPRASAAGLLAAESQAAGLQGSGLHGAGSLGSRPRWSPPPPSRPRTSAPLGSAPRWSLAAGSASSAAASPSVSPRQPPDTETNTTVGLGSMAAFTGGFRSRVLALAALALAAALGVWALVTKPAADAGTSVGVHSLRPPFEVTPRLLREAVPSGRRWQPTAAPPERAASSAAAVARPEASSAPPVVAEGAASESEGHGAAAPSAAPSSPVTSGASSSSAPPAGAAGSSERPGPAPFSAAGAFTSVAPGASEPADVSGEPVDGAAGAGAAEVVGTAGAAGAAGAASSSPPGEGAAGAAPRMLRGTAAPGAPSRPESGGEIRPQR